MANTTIDKGNVNFVIPGSDDRKASGKIKNKDLTSAENLAGNFIDDRIAIEYESDKGYQKIAEKVVEISANYLETQNMKKSELRKMFARFFVWVLGIQLFFLSVLIVLSSIECLAFNVSDYVLNTYTISVFAETLGAIGVMLSFSFTTKEESNIVNVLTSVIQNYQKYTNNSNKKGK